MSGEVNNLLPRGKLEKNRYSAPMYSPVDGTSVTASSWAWRSGGGIAFVVFMILMIIAIPTGTILGEDAAHHPTANPTLPTSKPTLHPTPPTSKPTKNPTKNPTKHPTKNPTKHPTKNPTKHPTKHPTKNPTKNPTTKSPTP